MRVAFVGKGGSGKTTLSSQFILHLVRGGHPVVAIDADVNQHLGEAIGLREEQIRQASPIGAQQHRLKQYLRGDNPRITSAEAMIKTTPPGRGSRLLSIMGSDPFHGGLAYQFDLTAQLMVTGGFDPDDIGVACYHSKIAAAELYLNHLVDGQGEYVVADMTAGADTFASGLFTRFDVIYLAVEPTHKGVSVYRQYAEYARDYDVTIKVIGNKVFDASDVAYLREYVGDALVTWFGHSPAIRAAEQGRSVARYEASWADQLESLRTIVDEQPKNWARFQEQTEFFHRRNAAAWANERVGQDLAEQIDPGFVMGPEALIRVV